MPKCSICFSPHHENIDIALTSGTSERNIAKQFGVSASAVHRHKADGHIQKIIEDAANEKRIQIGLNVSKCAKDVYEMCIEAATLAKDEDLRAFGPCIAQAVKVLEIMNKGDPDKPDEPPKESGFMAGYMKRAGEVYAKDQSPPS